MGILCTAHKKESKFHHFLMELAFDYFHSLLVVTGGQQTDCTQ